MSGLEEFLPLVTNSSPAAIIGAGAFFYYRVSTKRLEDTKSEYLKTIDGMEDGYKQRIEEMKEEHALMVSELKQEVEAEREERKRYRDLHESTLTALPDLTRTLGELADSIKQGDK